MHSLLSTLYARVGGAAELSLRLFVGCGQVADQTGFEEVAYEFFAQAFTIYEEAISDSRAQFQAVCVIAGGLHGTRNFSKENYDTLITKCALHGSKLLKKPDQCRAVYLASHLWWATEIRAKGEEDPKALYRDGKRVLECLQRALRVADACMDTAVSVELFVEILNRYVYYFDQENDAVSSIVIITTVWKFYILTCCTLGHDEIPQRAHRAHPLESAVERGGPKLREPATPFPEDARVYKITRVRRRGHGGEVS